MNKHVGIEFDDLLCNSKTLGFFLSSSLRKAFEANLKKNFFCIDDSVFICLLSYHSITSSGIIKIG